MLRRLTDEFILYVTYYPFNMTKNKVLATLKFLIVGIIITVILLLAFRYLNNSESAFPYPYEVKAISKREIKKAKKADLLIIGGSQGQNLKPFLDNFIQEVSKDLKSPLKVYNWARVHEPMGVTLKKIKSLESLPMITLYIGGSDELHTARFKVSEIVTIKKNLKRAENETLMTAMLTFPLLSRLVYAPVDKATLGVTKDKTFKKLPDTLMKHLFKLHYTLYKNEVVELLNLFKLKDATLWIAPAALDLEKPPLKACDYTEDQDSFDKRKKITHLLKKGQHKMALNEALDLVALRTPNAKNYFLLGHTLLKNGKFEQGRSALYHARMYDCGFSYSTPIHLKVLMEESELRGFDIIDFNRSVLNQLGRNSLFFSDQTPQNIFYSQFINELTDKFRKFLQR